MVFCIGNCWCSYRDPVAYLAIPFAIAQILYVTYCMTFHLVIPVFGVCAKSAFILISFYTILILILWSYSQAVFTEPGIPNKSILRRIDERDPCAKNYRHCPRCQLIKPYRAHHCRRCQKCILKMDHHCPWISNCVGARNQKPFMLFLLYVVLGETLAMWVTYYYIKHYNLLFQRYFHLIPMEYVFEGLNKVPALVKLLHRLHLHFPYFEPKINKQVFVCMHLIFSPIFCIFCAYLLFEQLKNIWTDRTYVEENWSKSSNERSSSSSSSSSSEEEEGENGTFYDSLIETMGEPFCLNWFIPLPGKNMDLIINKLSTAVVDDSEEVEEPEENNPSGAVGDESHEKTD